jgi:hypothetical protein
MLSAFCRCDRRIATLSIQESGFAPMVLSSRLTQSVPMPRRTLSAPTKLRTSLWPLPPHQVPSRLSPTSLSCLSSEGIGSRLRLRRRSNNRYSTRVNLFGSWSSTAAEALNEFALSTGGVYSRARASSEECRSSQHPQRGLIQTDPPLWVGSYYRRSLLLTREDRHSASYTTSHAASY